MKTTCTKVLRFCSGHRVVGHENKCANLHGHNYKVEITAMADRLDKIGRIIDFSVLKERVGGWIDENWDHKTILFNCDPILDKMVELHPNAIFPMYKNPTAENMASYLYGAICPDVLHGTNIQVIKVKLWETETCFAEATQEIVREEELDERYKKSPRKVF